VPQYQSYSTNEGSMTFAFDIQSFRGQCPPLAFKLSRPFSRSRAVYTVEGGKALALRTMLNHDESQYGTWSFVRYQLKLPPSTLALTAILSKSLHREPANVQELPFSHCFFDMLLQSYLTRRDCHVTRQLNLYGMIFESMLKPT